MAPDKNEQRITIKFMSKEGLSAKEIHDRLLHVHGRDALSRSTVQRWLIRFQNSEAVKDLPRSRRPKKRTDQKIQEVKNFVTGDCRRTVRQISRHCDISVGTANKIVKKDLRMHKASAQWVPHLLTAAQKERRVDMAMEALEMLETDEDPVQHVFTEDESWFWVWDPASKMANCQWITHDEERPTVVRVERSTLKTMLVVFFDKIGVVYHEWVPDGRGIGSAVYLEILERFRQAVQRKCPEAWRLNWALLHDGAPAHRARPTVDYLDYHGVIRMPHLGYSPDLSPPDYWLFARVKKEVRGHHYGMISALQAKVDQVLKDIPQAEFEWAMERYPEMLRRCIATQGDYFGH